MRNLLVAIVAIATISAFGRDLPILNGRLEGDLNANGHMVTNLAPPTATNDAATKGYVDAATNALLAAIPQPDLSGLASRDDVAQAIADIDLPPGWTSDSNTLDNVRRVDDMAAYTNAVSFSEWTWASAGDADLYIALTNANPQLEEEEIDGSVIWICPDLSERWGHAYYGVMAPDGSVTMPFTDGINYAYATARRTASTNYFAGADRLATTSGVAQVVASAALAGTNYTDSAIAAIPPTDLEPYETKTNAAATYAPRSVYQFVTGSNVWFAITNYNRQTGEIPTMSLYEIRDGATNLVWSERENISNECAKLQAWHNAQTPDPAWSTRTAATGLTNPVPGTTWIDTESTVIAAGLSYQRVAGATGSYWFLAANGMTAQIAATNGYFSITDDSGESSFTVRKSASYTVGVDIGSIDVTRVDGHDHISLVLPVVSYSAPVIEASPNLIGGGTWTTEFPATVVIGGVSGEWTADISMTEQANQYFFKAKVDVAGESMVEFANPLSVGGGIYCTDGIHKVRPVYTAGVITWEVVQ